MTKFCANARGKIEESGKWKKEGHAEGQSQRLRAARCIRITNTRLFLRVQNRCTSKFSTSKCV
eukprot:555401-Amphidinium_carterae.1